MLAPERLKIIGRQAVQHRPILPIDAHAHAVIAERPKSARRFAIINRRLAPGALDANDIVAIFHPQRLNPVRHRMCILKPQKFWLQRQHRAASEPLNFHRLIHQPRPLHF